LVGLSDSTEVRKYGSVAVIQSVLRISVPGSAHDTDPQRGAAAGNSGLDVGAGERSRDHGDQANGKVRSVIDWLTTIATSVLSLTAIVVTFVG